MAIEDPNLIRTASMLDEELEINDERLTGVAEPCVLNKIIGFHKYENIAHDKMHDIEEGVFHYDVCQALLRFHEDKSHKFKIGILNDRIKAFNFGPFCKNIPDMVTYNNLKNNHIQVTASESKSLLDNLMFLVGDLVDEGSDEWQIILLLKEISQIVSKNSIAPSDLDTIEYLVRHHNELYVKCYGATLKPKHHNLLHYRRDMIMYGPMKHYCSMRFESYHQNMKVANMDNKINLLLTIAIKNQIRQAKISLECFDIKDDFVGKSTRILISDFKNRFKDIDVTGLPNFLMIYNSFKINGREIKRNTVICVGLDEDNVPVLAEAQIFFKINNCVNVVVRSLNHEEFNFHLHAIRVTYSKFKVIIISEIVGDEISYVALGQDQKLYVNWR